MARDWKKLICPKCHVYFGDLDYTDYPNIGAKHVKIVHGRRSKMRDGASLACSGCGYEYTTWDIVLAGAAPEQGAMKPGERKEV